MTTIIRPKFGDAESTRSAMVGNATFARALRLGYGRITASALARQAKIEAAIWETPSEVAMRLVRPKNQSATLPLLGPGGAA